MTDDKARQIADARVAKLAAMTPLERQMARPAKAVARQRAADEAAAQQRLREAAADHATKLVRAAERKRRATRALLADALAALRDAHEALGAVWTSDGASLAVGIERKTRRLEELVAAAGKRQAVAR